MTTKVTSLVLANTTVAPGNYGGLTQIPSLAIDAQGRVTSAANNAVSSISISSGQVTGLAASATTDTTNASNITSGTLGSARLTGTYSISVSGNAGTVTNGFYTTSSFNLGTTSISVNRASSSQTLSGISIDGNAGTVTNGVVTTGSYANPSWITSLANSKITGLAASATTDTTNASNITSGTLGSARLTGTYAISVSGNAATATTAGDSSLFQGKSKLGLGITGETWNYVGGSRALNTTYTNTNSYPIMVIVSVNYLTGGSNSIKTTVNGLDINYESGNSSTDTNDSVVFIVPPGATYAVIITSGGVGIQNWVELY